MVTFCEVVISMFFNFYVIWSTRIILPMKESEFIEQNKEKWLDFENNLLKKDSDPSKTSKLFIQITDDLSYARTFYQNRSVKLYLNGIAKVLFNDLNKSQKKGSAAFFNFWKKDLPLTVYHSRR